jgi:FkbM family methyltransferase
MEVVRQHLRSKYGAESKLYRFASWVIALSRAVWLDGVTGARVVAARKESPSREITINLRKLAAPLTVRTGTNDIDSIINNVIREEYGQFACDRELRWIIDAGGYIGDTAAYFLTRFKQATVIVVEPDPVSVSLARRNLEPYGDRCTLMECALMDRGGWVTVQGEQTGAQVQRAEKGGVKAVSVDHIMDVHGIETIDVVKMDVEGAENELISKRAGEGWLRSVRLLLLETHGEEIEKRVLAVLRNASFKTVRYRNVWYCRNRRFCEV